MDLFVEGANLWFEWISLTWWRHAIVLSVVLDLLWLLRQREPQLRRSITIVCAVLLCIPPIVTVHTQETGSSANKPFVAGVGNNPHADKVEVAAQQTRAASITQFEEQNSGRDINLQEISASAAQRSFDAGRQSEITQLLFGFWLAGAFTIALRILQASRRHWKISRQSRPASVSEAPKEIGDIALRFHSGVEVPYATAWLSGARIVLPASWAGNWDLKKKAVLAHEVAHIKQRDHLWVLLFAVLKIVFWWNPLVWMLGRSYYTSAELCCDDIARANTGTSAADFAKILLECIPRTNNSAALTVGFTPKVTLIKQRISHQFLPLRSTPMRKTLITSFCLAVLPIMLLTHSSESNDWGLTLDLHGQELAPPIPPSSPNQSTLDSANQAVKTELEVLQESARKLQIDVGDLAAVADSSRLFAEQMTTLKEKLEMYSKELREQVELESAVLREKAGQESKRLNELAEKELVDLVDRMQAESERLNELAEKESALLIERMQVESKLLQEQAAKESAILQERAAKIQKTMQKLKEEAAREVIPSSETKPQSESRDSENKTEPIEPNNVDENDLGMHSPASQDQKLVGGKYTLVPLNMEAGFVPKEYTVEEQQEFASANPTPSAYDFGASVVFNITVNVDGTLKSIEVDKENSRNLYGPTTDQNLQGFIDNGLALLRSGTFTPKYLDGYAFEGSFQYVYEVDPVQDAIFRNSPGSTATCVR